MLLLVSLRRALRSLSWAATRLAGLQGAVQQVHYLKFPLANHLALPGSESIFGISQDPPMCVCASLSQDGFQRRDLWLDINKQLAAVCRVASRHKQKDRGAPHWSNPVGSRSEEHSDYQPVGTTALIPAKAPEVLSTFAFCTINSN
ncbi:uncharacterized protein AAG666_001621 isoform 1-T9 [Megaptera novaeangliae]